MICLCGVLITIVLQMYYKKKLNLKEKTDITEILLKVALNTITLILTENTCYSNVTNVTLEIQLQTDYSKSGEKIFLKIKLFKLAWRTH